MALKQRSSVFEHFTVTSDLKHYVCQCVTDQDDEETISASGTAHRGHVPTRASNLRRHLECCHPDIFKLVQEKDKASSATQTLSEPKPLSTEKKPATASLSYFS